MKTKSANNIIFVVSALVFFLQVVGYFAPAWFVQEVIYNHDLNGIYADGRRFKLPYFQNSQEPMDMPASPEPFEADDDDDMFPNKNDNFPPRGDPLRKRRAIQQPGVTKTEIEKECEDSYNSKCTSNGNKGVVDNDEDLFNTGKVTTTPGDEGKSILVPDNTNMINRPPEQAAIEETTAPDDDEKSILMPDEAETNNRPPTEQAATDGDFHIMENNNMFLPEIAETNTATPSGGQTNKKKQASKNKTKSLLYITAGLWYSKACITSREHNSDDAGSRDGMQWCTMYSRFDDNTLEKRMNIFELRIEATLGIVFCALCLLISSTACCSHRHHGRRALTSLASLFISGAITAVPVVHIILQHVKIHDKIVRPRKWMQLTKMMHVQHDLFDHYSVILCGTASLISVLSAFIITIISCRSNSKPDNWYNLNRVQEEKESKQELPINWVHNSKITVPPVSVIKDETKEESESGYSEVRDDVKDDVTSSIHDGGSTGNDSDTLEFDPKEMTTFDM